VSNYKVGAIFTPYGDDDTRPVDTYTVDLERVMEGAPFPALRGDWHDVYAAVGKAVNRAFLTGGDVLECDITKEGVEPEDEGRIKVRLIMEE